MVTLTGIEKKYGDQTALYPLKLTFAKNAVTALIGPSGCGKSTLLRIVLGLIEPSSGTIDIDGTAMTPNSAQNLRQQIGYVVQDGGLFPHLTCAENVALMARYLKRPEDAIQKKLDELSALTHLPKETLSRYPGELSGGQKQRVGLMRALALEPKLLLLDEPLGALDPLVRAGLQTDLKEIFIRLGQTVIFVTHDMGEAAFLADHIVLLRDGKLVQEGTLDEFQKKPADPFVTEFLSAQRLVGAIA